MLTSLFENLAMLNMSIQDDDRTYQTIRKQTFNKLLNMLCLIKIAPWKYIGLNHVLTPG